jgi:hypothetical protein
MLRKKVLLLLFSVIVTGLFARENLGFKYQSVLRNPKGYPIANKDVGIRLTVFRFNDVISEKIFIEEHTKQTNKFGLVELNVGKGSNILGKRLDSIDWSVDAHYFMGVELDTIGDGVEYLNMGSSELQFVPFAIHALNAEGAFSGNYNDLTNKPTNLSQFINDIGYINNETDPIFIKSVANGITSADTSRWNNRIVVETDPLFVASPANAITNANIVNWNKKLELEVDPEFNKSVAKGITSIDTSRWNSKLDIETDPVFNRSVAKGISSIDTLRWNNKLDKETDPEFNKSVAKSISALDVLNWNNKLDKEKDPLFSASVAKGITSIDTARWNKKVDVEIDPLFNASASKTITFMDIARWNAKLNFEADPDFNASPSSGITAVDIINWNNKLDKENDPVFNGSPAKSITNTDITNWNNKLDTELDPIFGASPAKTITNVNIVDWNNKLDTELDPIFDASPAKTITTADITNWNNKLDAETQNLANVLGLGANANDIQITNSPTPLNDKDVANKKYVDDQITSAATKIDLNEKFLLIGNAANKAEPTLAKGDIEYVSKAEGFSLTNSAVETDEIEDDAVTTDKILDGTIKNEDIENYTITSKKQITTVQAKSGNIVKEDLGLILANTTVNLPTGNINGLKYTIKNVSNAPIQVNAGAYTIDGKNAIALQNKYEFITIVGNNNEWFVISDYKPSYLLDATPGTVEPEKVVVVDNVKSIKGFNIVEATEFKGKLKVDNLDGIVPIVKGGTGANNEEGARDNLELGKNNDVEFKSTKVITSIIQDALKNQKWRMSIDSDDLIFEYNIGDNLNPVWEEKFRIHK